MDATQELHQAIKQAPLPLIAGRMRRARRDSGLSHDVIGERMGGVTRQHLIKLEKGRHRPGAEMLQRFADAVGKPVSYFLDADAVDNPFPEDAEAA